MRFLLLMAMVFGLTVVVGCEKSEPDTVNVQVEEEQQEEDSDFSLKFKNDDGSVQIEDKD